MVFFFSCFGSQVSVSNPAPKQQDPQKIVQPAAQLAAQPDAQPQPQDPLVQSELRGLTLNLLLIVWSSQNELT